MGTGDAGLPPQPARAARRAIGCGERGRRARGRADGAAGGRRLLGGRRRARRISGSHVRRVASRQISRVVGSQTSRIAGSRTRRIIDGRIRRVADGQISHVTLFIVRALLHHRLPSLPFSSQKSPLKPSLASFAGAKPRMRLLQPNCLSLSCACRRAWGCARRRTRSAA